MILISRKVDYAILVLCELTRSQDATSARELAGTYGLSRPFIANILKELCRNGFVESERGAKGGYRLAKAPSEISLAMVITTLEGPFRLMSCAGEDSEADCSLFHACPIKSPLHVVHRRLLATLEQVTLVDLASDPNFVPLEEDADGCAADLPR